MPRRVYFPGLPRHSQLIKYGIKAGIKAGTVDIEYFDPATGLPLIPPAIEDSTDSEAAPGTKRAPKSKGAARIEEAPAAEDQPIAIDTGSEESSDEDSVDEFSEGEQAVDLASESARHPITFDSGLEELSDNEQAGEPQPGYYSDLPGFIDLGGSDEDSESEEASESEEGSEFGPLFSGPPNLIGLDSSDEDSDPEQGHNSQEAPPRPTVVQLQRYPTVIPRSSEAAATSITGKAPNGLVRLVIRGCHKPRHRINRPNLRSILKPFAQPALTPNARTALPDKPKIRPWSPVPVLDGIVASRAFQILNYNTSSSPMGTHHSHSIPPSGSSTSSLPTSSRNYVSKPTDPLNSRGVKRSSSMISNSPAGKIPATSGRSKKSSAKRTKLTEPAKHWMSRTTRSPSPT